MRSSKRTLSALSLVLFASPGAFAQVSGLPATPTTVVDVPSPLFGVPTPPPGGALVTYAGDGAHQRVSVGYELVAADWFLLSLAAGLSVSPSADTTATSEGLRSIDRSWIQAALGLGFAPAIRVLDGDVALHLVPLGRVSADAALAFDDPVVPYRLRGEAGALVELRLDLGLRASLGATYDYDLTHFATEKIGEAATLRLAATLGYLFPEVSGFAKDQTPTLLTLGVGQDVALTESPTRPTGLTVTLGVAL